MTELWQHRMAKHWKGFQLIAVDGSTVSLPPSKQIKDYFGVYAEKGKGIKSCLAQVLLFYDVCSEVVIKGSISKMSDSEKVLFKDCLPDLPLNKSIFILDRGFGHFNICKYLMTQKRDFCIRLGTSQSNFNKHIMGSVLHDFITVWAPSESEKRTCTSYGQDCNAIKVRVSKIRLKSGEIEILISSLFDTNLFTTADISTLYGMRWGIEEGFKKLKPKMKMEHFGSRKPEGIFQEFQAHIFMMNMVAIMGMNAQDKITKKMSIRKMAYKYNWQNAFRFIRKHMVKLIVYQEVEILIDKLTELISRSVIPIKKGRSFERVTFKKRKNRMHQNYK